LRSARAGPSAKARWRNVKVFSQVFFKKLVGFGVKPQDLTGVRGVLVPGGHRSGPVYVATSVGAGRLPLADSTRGGSRDQPPPSRTQKRGGRTSPTGRDAMKTLGIIGGMGPMATAYLLELIIQMTDAKTDQEHLSVIVLDNPQVPDRTSYILDSSKPSPLPVLEHMAHTLQGIGAGVLCAPCVTSHYFYEELAGSVTVPFVHMVKETARELRLAGKQKAGILATTGTVQTGLFQ